jgi:hypothetical protein
MTDLRTQLRTLVDNAAAAELPDLIETFAGAGEEAPTRFAVDASRNVEVRT